MDNNGRMHINDLTELPIVCQWQLTNAQVLEICKDNDRLEVHGDGWVRALTGHSVVPTSVEAERPCDTCGWVCWGRGGSLLFTQGVDRGWVCCGGHNVHCQCDYDGDVVTKMQPSDLYPLVSQEEVADLPEFLFHTTWKESVLGIFQQGLRPGGPDGSTTSCQHPIHQGHHGRQHVYFATSPIFKRGRGSPVFRDTGAGALWGVTVLQFLTNVSQTQVTWCWGSSPGTSPT